MIDGVERTKTELKPCPFCGVRGKVEPRGGFMTAAFRHADRCFFNHGLPDRPMVLHESEFEEWNKRVFECIASDDGTIEILGHRFAPLRTCRMEYNEDWSGDELYPTEAYQCSVCGRITQEGLPNYCPRCGAKVMAQ